MKRSKMLIAAAAIVATAGLTTTAAFAYFTAGGTGSSAATVGTSTPWNITFSALSPGPLYPDSGKSNQTFSYKVTNDNSGIQYLNTVTAAFADDGSNPDHTLSNVLDANGNAVKGCLQGWFKVFISGDGPGQYAQGESNKGTGTVSMFNDPNRNQNACEGISPKFIITAT